MGEQAREVEERPWILLFDSIHHCLAAERALKAREVWHDVVPVPRSLSSDCGMAVEFRRSDLETVRDMQAEGSIRPKAAYRRAADGHELEEAFGPGDGVAGGDAPKSD